jgi:gluconokinase
MSEYILGVDIGTGSTKAVALNNTGKVIFTTHASYPTLQPQPGYSEQSPELIWQAFVQCINQSVASLGTPRVIALSSAMHSLVPLDASHTPLGNLILWSDNRSSAIADRIHKSAAGEMLYEQTGTPIHAMSPLCKIVWLREQAPEIYNSARKFISVKEYIWFKLFGVFEIDHSIASATGLFDIEKLTWNSNALELCGLDTQRLSTPVSTGFARSIESKPVADQLQIPATTRFVIGASDGCLANLGSFAMRKGIAALTIGTSGAIRVTTDKPVYHFGAMTFNYRLDEQTFIAGGPINNGGVVLKWYAENFLGHALTTGDDYNSLLQSLTDIQPGSDGLTFLPYVLGERAPIWNSEACGVFFGARVQHKQAHFTRAVLEGISLALYHVGRSLERDSAITQINVSGGFVRSLEWVQLLTDIFGKPVCLVQAEDASATGAAYLAMRALGIITHLHEIEPTGSQMFYPNPEHHRIYAQEVFPRYKRLYEALQPEMELLSQRQPAFPAKPAPLTPDI